MLERIKLPMVTLAAFYTQLLGQAAVLRAKFPQEYDTLILKILINLPLIAKEDKGFFQVMKSSALMPAANNTLARIDGLYDPTNIEIKRLLDHEYFPSEKFCAEELLPVLRSLGLRVLIDWQGVINCATSVETIPEQQQKLKTERASVLLQYLDKNIARLLGEEPASKTSGGFSLFGSISALFNDKGKQENAEDLELYISQLRTIRWLPVLELPPVSYMPWPKDINSACSMASETVSLNDAWYCSATRRVVAQPITSNSLKKCLMWDQLIDGTTYCIQLKEISAIYQSLPNGSKEKYEMQQTISNVVHNIYDRLNKCQDIDKLRPLLENVQWIWLGQDFVGLTKTALVFPFNAAPYLHQLPESFKVYTRLLETFEFKCNFSYRDFIEALREMALSTGYDSQSKTSSPLSNSMVDVAISLVTLIANEGFHSLQSQMIFVPDINCKLVPSTELVNDDVPWLIGPEFVAIRSACRFVHPSISTKVGEKVGVKSMRLSMLSKSIESTMFAASNATIESFGQAESLTNRLKTILDLYPDGSPILNELIQNSDDAGATCVKIIIDENSYETESLMDRKMEALQGPALLFQNDAVFTEADFKSLASVGQGSKLEKLATTGRFGLGFNSTYHLTDTPMFVSGDYFVFFDPHCAYVPGATINQPGIKFRFTESNLSEIFPNQFEPFKHSNFDAMKTYQGTLFRFPLRTSAQAKSSEICKRSYKLTDLEGMVEQMIENFSRILLFLRSVKRIEIYRCHEGNRVEQLIHAVSSSTLTKKTINDQALLEFFEKQSSNAAGLSRESFYRKLMSTNDNTLPKVVSTKQITLEFCTNKLACIYDVSSIKIAAHCESSKVVIEYEIVQGLGGGDAKRLACSESARHLKLVPLGGIAACVSISIIYESGNITIDQNFPALNGQAFCFLPLPVKTNLPVHINAYWELSSNRRDIWRGEDTKGESKLRSGMLEIQLNYLRNRMPSCCSLTLIE